MTGTNSVVKEFNNSKWDLLKAILLELAQFFYASYYNIHMGLHDSASHISIAMKLFFIIAQ